MLSLQNVKFNVAPVQGILILVLLLYVITPADAFIRHLCYNPLGFGRLDPIVSPGNPSAHVHHIHGSSGVGLSTTPDQLLGGNCTSCSITVDHSSYWTPAMYFKHEDGTLELMNTSAAITIYYKLEKRVNFETQNYTLFPQGFRMIAGNSSKRTWDGPWPVPDQSHWGPADITQQALAEKALGFNCLNYASGNNEGFMEYPYMRNKSFIDAHCTDGIRAELMFPSCWNGVDLDSTTHNTHVAFPTLVQDGACPPTHPVYLPILFFETIWNTQDFKGIPGDFVFANGDPTGYGYHGDFIAAWKDGILQQMQTDPTCTDHNLENRTTNGLQEDCKAIAPFLQNESDAAKCHLEMPQVLQDEQTGGILSTLPGAVNITGSQHAPGSQVGPAPVNFSSSAIASSIPASSTSIVASVPAYTAQPAASASATVAASLATSAASSSISSPVSVAQTSAPAGSSAAVVLTTSTFISDGTYIELVIAEEVVTTTVMAGGESSLVARHGHAHGHSKHL